MFANRRHAVVAVLAASIAVAAVLPPSGARADSGVLNLHIDLGLALPLAGEAGPVEPENKVYIGGIGNLALDWQFSVPIAAEVMFGFGWLPFEADFSDGVYGSAALGVRVRFLDNMEGYGDEEGGDYLGNTWVSGHIGYVNWQGSQLGLDLGVGYEASVLRPLSIGAYVRGQLLFLGETPPMVDDKIDFIVTVGVSFSIELISGVEAVDSDGDTLSDEREVNRWRTNPNNPDTDADGINDGLETRTETDPTRPDTDNDSLSDGSEDANRSGGLDPGESDPRVADTDQGGAPDGWETQNRRNTRDRSDDDQDQDRVIDHVDACLGTPPGTEVDQRGCAILRAQMVLSGVEFAFDSAEILPESEQTLQRAVQVLRDNPEAHVEVGGHTDNQGNAQYNQRLSQQRATSVRDWLVAHGIDAPRLRVRGYGAARPTADNATEEGRARNRRIEFTRTDTPPTNPPSN